MWPLWMIIITSIMCAAVVAALVTGICLLVRHSSECPKICEQLKENTNECFPKDKKYVKDCNVERDNNCKNIEDALLKSYIDTSI